MANGDGGEFVHFLTDPRGRRTQVTQFKDKASLESLGQDRYLYLLSRRVRHMRNDAISPGRLARANAGEIRPASPVFARLEKSCTLA